MLFRPARSRVVQISCWAVAVWLLGRFAVAEEWEFRVTFSDTVHQEPYSGRLYLFFASREDPEPRLALDWFQPAPVLARDVKNWTGRESVTFRADDPEVFKYPVDWDNVTLSGYRVQAAARFNPWERSVGNGAGNGFSKAVSLNGANVVDLLIDRTVPKRRYPKTEWSEEFCVRSELLSRFYGRDVVMRSAVNLPKSYYSRPKKRYPAVFEIPGFGGTHFPHHGARTRPTPMTNELGVEFIEVVLDPSCPFGHHVFADSDNNGPWGTALVTEFIPALDAAWRTDARPQARFLTGHSSGGWSSLWLQVMHPNVFGGTWSTAPDPVDFRDFQRINIYRTGENMFVDDHGSRRPLARMQGRAVLWYDDFSRMEDLLGYGGQLHSFEAVFSCPTNGHRPVDRFSMIDAPLLPTPQPALLWDRATGAIDPAVAEQWKRYDIRLFLEENWSKLGPKLDGKLHIIMGADDTFYLEGATRRLKESLEQLGSDAVVEIVPGRDHMDLLDEDLVRRIESEMAASYVKQTGPST